MTVAPGVVGRPRRAVVLVPNPQAPYSRGLRLARSLERAGYRVEIAATRDARLPDRALDGTIEIRRYGPAGGLAGEGASVLVDPDAPVVRRLRATLGNARRRIFRWRDAIRWPGPETRAWQSTLVHELEPADLYHCCGVHTLVPALRVRRLDPRGGGRVIYDVIDEFFASNMVLEMPGPLRRFHARREIARAQQADAVVTVNRPLAERLSRRWGLARPVTSIENFPEPPPAQDAGAPRPDLIRRELGLDASTPIVLFQGRLGPNHGLDEAAEAVLLVPGAVFVLIGFGRWEARLRARDADPRFRGRHFTLAARHPDELLGWTASADVSLVLMPALSVNQRHTSPNKFWESIQAGTPVVVLRESRLLVELVEESDLGRVAPSLEPASIARSITEILEIPAEERDRWRRRIAATARERYSWPVAEARYRALVDELVGDARAGAATLPTP